MSIAFGIFKFFRLKPLVITLSDKDFERDGEDYTYKITKSVHKKGSHPTVNTSLLLADGSIQSISIYDEVDGDGNIKIAHSGMVFDEKDRQLRVIIKA